ncbi:hypothetical protein BGZ59_001405, partial [Podila verticillata]
GLNAEEKQIPFFLPYESTSKEMLELMLRTIGGLSKGKEKPVVKLADPFRKELIVNHRRGISEYGKIMSSDEYAKFNFTTKPPKSQSAPLSWVGLKPIYLNEINPTSDHVLDGFVLELTLITVPFNNNMSISFVAEDSNLNVQRVSLYNFDKKHILAIGAKISVINPYLRTAMDGRPLIRVDDPNSSESVVTAMEQTKKGVMVRTSDGMIHEGEILVGDDGAYSTIHQNIYEKLDKIGQLPISDAKPLPFRYIGLVGRTTPQNPKDFPELEREDSPFMCIIGDHKHSAAIFTTQSNAIAWIAVKFLDTEGTREKYNSHNSDWGPASVEEMCKAVYNFAIPGGNGLQVLGNLNDKSPKLLISKIMMEEKLFHTWYHQRTVLIGDGECLRNKLMHPVAGLCAMNAMQDAVTLANWLNVLPSGSSLQEVEMCFKEYRDERFPLALKAYRQSEGTSTLLAQNLFGRVIRFILSYLPIFIIAQASVLGIENRPQVAFLPPVTGRSTIKPIPQRSLFMAKQIMLERAKALIADHRPEISGSSIINGFYLYPSSHFIKD